MSDAAASLTERIAGFVAAVALDRVPPAIIAKVKLHLLDTIGCAVAGMATSLAEQARAAGRAWGAGCGPIFGSAERLAAPAAAFVNAMTANALDFDDGFEVDGKGMGHPGASIVPAALAAASMTEVDGRGFLEALIAAYEVNGRLAHALQPSPERFREAHGVACHQSISAAIAAARIGGFGPTEIVNAIGIGGALSCVPSLHKYNWRNRPLIDLKDFVAPAAEAGVKAVILSRAGMVGSRDLLDGAQGYWRMLGSDRFDPDRLIGELGERWRLEDHSFKLYPACRWLHPALEAAETLVAAHALSPAAVEAIHARTSSLVADLFADANPLGMIDAQFSLPYTIAAVIHRLPKGPAWYSGDALAAEAILATARQVHIAVDPGCDGLMRGETRRPAAVVEIHAAAGTSHSCRIDAPSGGRLRPVADATIIDKALRNLEAGVSRIRAETIIDTILRVETLPSLAPLTTLLFERD